MSDAESGSGSESDVPMESIIHTRARRSNAGLRMKALLAAADKEESEDEFFREVENDDDFDLEAFSKTTKTVGDSDFSSDSGLSEEDTNVDEGERQLLRQQRLERKEQRKRERNKMFKIKQPQEKPKKKKPERSAEDTIEILMAQTRRSSQRSSAIDNRNKTIERLLETERKRSEYAPAPTRKKAKLTQAQRLAEAKLTEQKNTASLHNFLEVEEQRKHAQRMALLNKRAKLKNVVRWVSSAAYKPVQVIEPQWPGDAEAAGSGATTEAPGTSGAPGTLPAAAPGSSEAPGATSPTASTAASEPTTPPAPTSPQIPYGPEQIYPYNFLTLEKFVTPVPNKLAARTIIFGERNVKPPQFPNKRLCPITGAIAKYVDPKSNLAYLNINIYRLYKRIANHEYVWNCAAGGVYTQPWVTEHHAKGVPPGFANESELPPRPEGLVTDEELWEKEQTKVKAEPGATASVSPVTASPAGPAAPEHAPSSATGSPAGPAGGASPATPATPGAPSKVKIE